MQVEATTSMVRNLMTALLFAVGLGCASTAQAQAAAGTAAPEHRWSVDVGIGFDSSISGNINSSAIGTLSGTSVVILKNKYEDVYGTGLNFRFGGGYMFKPNTELRVNFTLQSLDADLTRMGDFGASNLYAQYDDYQSFSMDVGLRQYMSLKPSIRAYGEGTIGLGFIGETDVTLTAPAVGLTLDATDFYDRTAAFTFGINAGLLFDLKQNVGAVSNIAVYTQLGLRYVSGLADVDQLVATGLNTINDESQRWAIPFTVGVRFQF
jgi:hypothetical protein